MPLLFQVKVVWIVMLCSVVVGYQCFTLKTEAAWTSETLVSYHSEDLNLKHHCSESLNTCVFFVN